jgi:hypothetical protein
MTGGSACIPRASSAPVTREWLVKRRKSPPIVRVASPILMQMNPPGRTTRAHSLHTSSRSACIRSHAPGPSPPARHSPIAASCRTKVSSHIAIIGYGGDVTTSSTEASATPDRSLAEAKTTRWSVCMAPILPSTVIEVIHRAGPEKEGHRQPRHGHSRSDSNKKKEPAPRVESRPLASWRAAIGPPYAGAQDPERSSSLGSVPGKLEARRGELNQREVVLEVGGGGRGRGIRECPRVAVLGNLIK